MPWQTGESPQRLAVLPAWRDTALFTDRERAALALAESITELPDQRSREHEEGYARRHLTADEFSAVSWLAITMNAFNRVSITSHHPVRARSERGPAITGPVTGSPTVQWDRQALSTGNPHC